MKRFSVLFFLMTGAVAVTAEDNTPATAVSVAAEIPFTEAVAERYPETAAAGSASAVRHYSTMNTSYDHCHYSEEHQHDHCYEAGEPHACPSQTTTRTVYRDRRVIIDDSPADDIAIGLAIGLPLLYWSDHHRRSHWRGYYRDDRHRYSGRGHYKSGYRSSFRHRENRRWRHH